MSRVVAVGSAARVLVERQHEPRATAGALVHKVPSRRIASRNIPEYSEFDTGC